MGVLLENPILVKEVRSRLRARRQLRGNRVAGIVVVCFAIFLSYFFSLQALLGGSDTRSNGEGLYLFYKNGLEMMLVLLMIPALAAASITQEREQQTWNALLLSRLTPAEIVIGKFVAAALPALLIQLIFFPLCFIAAFIGDVGAVRYLLSNLMLLSCVAFFTAVSLFWSWACRRTFIATAASFATMLFFVVGTFLIWGLLISASLGRSEGPQEFFLTWLNPFVAMWSLVDSQVRFREVGIICMIIYFLAAALLLLMMIRRLPYGAKELEQ